MKKKTGLYFGSFNPIHNGHLIIAEQILANSDLQEIWFVISPHNPLKERASLLDDHHRLALVKIAIDDNPSFRASDIEFTLPKPSYTIHTLLNLESKYPTHQFCLIMGSDNLTIINKWFNYDQILEHYNIYVYPRPGFDGGEFYNHRNISWVNAPLIEISSSYIRNSIAYGKSVRYLLQPKVYEYILEMHFYEK